MSALLLAQVALTMRPPHDTDVRTMLAALVDELATFGGISERDLSDALVRRGSDPNQTSAERGLLEAAAASCSDASTARPDPTNSAR